MATVGWKHKESPGSLKKNYAASVIMVIAHAHSATHCPFVSPSTRSIFDSQALKTLIFLPGTLNRQKAEYKEKIIDALL